MTPLFACGKGSVAVLDFFVLNPDFKSMGKRVARFQHIASCSGEHAVQRRFCIGNRFFLGGKRRLLGGQLKLFGGKLVGQVFGRGSGRCSSLSFFCASLTAASCDATELFIVFSSDFADCSSLAAACSSLLPISITEPSCSEPRWPLKSGCLRR
jgi:hypothetical protein